MQVKVFTVYYGLSVCLRSCALNVHIVEMAKVETFEGAIML